MMRLWDPDDPYGIAAIRRVLLWFTPAILVIGANRVLRRGDEWPPFLIAAALVLVLALTLEPTLKALRGART